MKKTFISLIAVISLTAVCFGWDEYSFEVDFSDCIVTYHTIYHGQGSVHNLIQMRKSLDNDWTAPKMGANIVNRPSFFPDAAPHLLGLLNDAIAHGRIIRVAVDLDNDLFNHSFAVTSLTAVPQEGNRQSVTILEDNFESGNLGAAWTTYTTDNGRVDVATGYGAGGGYSLLLDCNQSGTYSYSAAILSVDLSGYSNCGLEFDWHEFGDENHSQDGVFVSTDGGSNWTMVLSFNDGPSSYKSESIDLSSYDGQNIEIKFQFYDNYSIDSDGYTIDNVKVIGQ